MKRICGGAWTFDQIHGLETRYKVVPPSYKLVYNRINYSNYSYINHKLVLYQHPGLT